MLSNQGGQLSEMKRNENFIQFHSILESNFNQNGSTFEKTHDFCKVKTNALRHVQPVYFEVNFGANSKCWPTF